MERQQLKWFSLIADSPLHQRSPTPGLRPCAGPWPEPDRAAKTDLPSLAHTHPCTACMRLHAHSSVPMGALCRRLCMSMSAHAPTQAQQHHLCMCMRALALKRERSFVHVHEHGGAPPSPASPWGEKDWGPLLYTTGCLLVHNYSHDLSVTCRTAHWEILLVHMIFLSRIQML